MFNVYVNDGSLKELPSDPVCYIVAKDGIYLKKELDNVSSLTKVDKVDCLDELQSYGSLKIPKIPSDKFSKVVDFFRKVYDAHRSEGVILLYLNPTNKNIKIVVPKQEVSGGSADYEADFSVDNYDRIGTIHSHANFGAFHSGTDTNDEASFDGLHITVGNVKDRAVSISSCVVINGERFKVAPEEYVEGISKASGKILRSTTSTKSWKKNKKKKWKRKEFKNQEKYFNKLFKFNFDGHENFKKDEDEKDVKSSWTSFTTTYGSDRYVLESEVKCNDKWLKMVSKRTWNSYKVKGFTPYQYSWQGRNYDYLYGRVGYKQPTKITYPGKNPYQPAKKFINGVEVEQVGEDKEKGIIYYKPTKEEKERALAPVDIKNEFSLDESKRTLITEIPCNKCIHRFTKMELEIEELTEEELPENLKILKETFPDATREELDDIAEAMDSLPF